MTLRAMPFVIRLLITLIVGQAPFLLLGLLLGVSLSVLVFIVITFTIAGTVVGLRMHGHP